MKRLLNTLYITSGNRYLSLDGENVVVMEDKKEIGRMMLSRLVDTFFSRTSWTMLPYVENHSISVA